MDTFLRLIGIKPLKFLRLITAVIVLASVILAVGLYITPGAQYGWQIISSSQRVNKISFAQCMVQEEKTCVLEVIKKNQLSDIVSVSTLITKVESFYEKHKSTTNEEQATLDLNHAINEILSNMDLKQHFAINGVRPFFGFFKKDVCVIRSGEKDIELRILDKLAARSTKQRQTTYEKYPANQELIHIFVRRHELIPKLYIVMEEVFPKAELAKCAKAYAKQLEKMKSQLEQ